MSLFFRKLIFAGVLAALVIQLTGCGETFQGIGKDVHRVGKGVKTIFIRDGE